MRKKNLVFLLTFSLLFSTVSPLMVNAEDLDEILTFEESLSLEEDESEENIAIEDDATDILEEVNVSDPDAEPEEQTIEEQVVSEEKTSPEEFYDDSALAVEQASVQDLAEENETSWNEITESNLAYRYVGTVLQIKLLDPNQSQGKADYTSSVMPKWDSDSESAKAATRIEIQSGITSVGARWFYSYGQRYFQKVTEVDLASTVKTIGISAFDGGAALRSIDLTNVTNINVGAFQATALEQISLKNATSIGAAAFNKCSKLKSLSFGQAGIQVQNSAFSGCTSLATGEMCYVGDKNSWTTICNKEKKGLSTIPFVHCKAEEAPKVASCTEAGDKTSVCGICGESYKDDENGAENPALGHDYATEFTTDVEPSCTAAGSQSRHCTRCDEADATSAQEISALGHDYVSEVTTQPTCTKEGVNTLTCSRCNDTKTEAIPAMGHDYVSETTQPTCTKDGVRTFTCSRCKDAKTEGIPAMGHDYVSEVTTQPTCTKDGVRTFTCSRCKDVKTETIPATGVHQWSSWKKTADATVFAAEQQEKTCGTCGRKETQTVGNKLTATATVKVSSVTLKEKQSISSVKVTGMAKGDSVKTWKSTNTKVFTVAGKADGTCKLTGVKKGTAKLEITLASGLKKTVTVKVQAKTITTSKISGLAKKITVKKGAKTTLKPVITPSTSQQKVTYSSSNKSVATVSSKGVITAKKAGTAKITVKSGSKQVTVTVTVPKTKTTAITVGKKVSVKKGKTYSLKAKVKPSNSDEKITYSTSNKKIATVSKSGKIKGVKKGTATITVKSGKITKKVKVTVK